MQIPVRTDTRRQDQADRRLAANKVLRLLAIEERYIRAASTAIRQRARSTEVNQRSVDEIMAGIQNSRDLIPTQVETDACVAQYPHLQEVVSPRRARILSEERRIGNRSQIPSRDDEVMATQEIGNLAAMIRQLQTDFAGFAAWMNEGNSSAEAENEVVREAVGAAAEAFKRELAASHLRQQENLAEVITAALARSNMTLALYDLLEQVLGNAVMAKYAILRLLQEYLGGQNEKPEAIIARIQKDQDECERDVGKMVRENKMTHYLSSR